MNAPRCVAAANVAMTAVEAWHHESYDECCTCLLLLGYGWPAMNPEADPRAMRMVAEWVYKLRELYRSEWDELHRVGLAFGPYGCGQLLGNGNSPTLADPTTDEHEAIRRAGIVVWPQPMAAETQGVAAR